LKEKLIGTECLDAVNRRVGLIQHFVDQKHRLSVRDHRLNLGFGHHWHHWLLSENEQFDRPA
jgi:hypothetical protein